MTEDTIEGPPPWRCWRVTRRIASWLYSLGLVRGTAIGMRGGGPLHLIDVSWVWEHRSLPPYVLFVSTNHWRCLLRFHHWPGEHVGMGFCGKCMPWPCCGSTTLDHTDHCTDPEAGRPGRTHPAAH